MRTTVYIIRHAEAEGNVYRRCHGQYNALLTTRAYKQLPYLAKRFENVPLAAVYSSDLFRARVTAQAYPVRCRECFNGSFPVLKKSPAYGLREG